VEARIETARNHGIDLTLFVEQLRLTPAERARKPERASMVRIQRATQASISL
jgi:hypothetical protein